MTVQPPMMSVDEAFEKLADALTPSPAQLAEVERLRESLWDRLSREKKSIAAIEPLVVLVVGNKPWTLFAIAQLGDPLSPTAHLLDGWVRSLLPAATRDWHQLPGSDLRFQVLVGVIAEKRPKALPWLPYLGASLPAFTEATIGPAARLARLIFLVWGSPPPSRLLGLASDIRKHAEAPAVRTAEALRDALASSAEPLRQAVRADYALHLEKQGRLAEAHAQWRELFSSAWPVDPGPLPTRDVISEVSVENLRSIASVQLPLHGLTVLIGENGSGKSTLLEACELLRRMASPAFVDELHSIHGGLRLLQRHGTDKVVLRVEVSGADVPLQYEVHLVAEGAGVVIARERLHLGLHRAGAPTMPVIDRDRVGARVPSHTQNTLNVSNALTLTSFGSNPPDPAFTRMIAALKDIEVHVPFEVTPAWVGRAHGRQSVLRGVSMIQAATTLERLGINLANAYHALRSDGSEAHWRETMDYVRLGLGERIESVNTRADVSGGAIALWVKLRGRDEQIPAASLSEGTLAYLAFVALFRLPSRRSLLVFDEPELHLHPRLLTRVMGFLDSLAAQSPVMLATHSRRLLDTLQDPASSVVLCELDEANTTRLLHPDRAALEAWLTDYEGLGRLLDAGYESEVMVRREEG